MCRLSYFYGTSAAFECSRAKIDRINTIKTFSRPTNETRQAINEEACRDVVDERNDILANGRFVSVQHSRARYEHSCMPLSCFYFRPLKSIIEIFLCHH